MGKNHQYNAKIRWVGNLGKGTSGYREYGRNHVAKVGDKPEILLSSDPNFRGDATCYNPEEMFVISLSSCHMLWYLHLCADEGVVVTDYTDNAEGTMVESSEGSGRFIEVMLNPTVTVKDKSMVEKAEELHHNANQMCFIANSCNFPVKHKPVIKAEN